jgi:hypothetical protein
VRAINGGEEWERERDTREQASARARASAYHDSLSLSLCVRPSQQTAVRLCRASGSHARAPTLAARLSAARLDSCARGNLAAAPISHIFDSAAGREECTSARGGRFTHSLGSGSECDGLAVKHRHTHSLTRRAEPVGELALKADQIRAARREKQQRHEQRSKQRATSER